MNCKPDDIAIVTAPYAMQGRGAFVKVIRPYRSGEILIDRQYVAVTGSRLAWVCDGFVRNQSGERLGPLVAISDECLRPIRPEAEPETTETLRELETQ